MLLRSEFCVALDIFLAGRELAEMSRRILLFLRSAGEPLAETDVLDAFRGVVIFRTPVWLFSELLDDTLLMLTWSAVPTLGMESRCRTLTEDAVLVDETRLLAILSAL